MPFNLLVIFTPKKVEVDDDGEVIESKLQRDGGDIIKAETSKIDCAPSAESKISESAKSEPVRTETEKTDLAKTEPSVSMLAENEQVKAVESDNAEPVGTKSADTDPTNTESLKPEPVKSRVKSDMDIVSDSTRTIRRNSRIPSFSDSEFSVMIKSSEADTTDTQDADRLEGSSRNIIEKKSESNVITTEVNVENFLKEALDILLKQEYISTAPTIVEDQTGQNIQVTRLLRVIKSLRFNSSCSGELCVRPSGGGCGDGSPGTHRSRHTGGQCECDRSGEL